MRKKWIALMLIIGILLTVFLIGCENENLGKNNEKSVGKLDNDLTTVAEDDEEKIIKDFRNIVKSNNEPFALINFIDENIGKIEKPYRLEMITELEQVQEEYIEEYTEQLFIDDYQMELLNLSTEQQSGIQLFFDESKVEEIKNGNLKELVDKILKGKYKLINMEGAFYPIIDYEALKEYNKHLPDEIKDYIEIKSMDSNMPTALDGGLTISFDELAERLIKTEGYILKYPESIKYEEALRLYGWYLKLYLEGAPNSSIFDYQTKEIKDEVLSSYNEVKNMDETVTSGIVTKYIDIIQANENIIDENVFSNITEFHNEAIATLENQK